MDNENPYMDNENSYMDNENPHENNENSYMDNENPYEDNAFRDAVIGLFAGFRSFPSFSYAFLM